MKAIITFAIIFVLLIVIFNMLFFYVDETKQAIVLRFGKIVKVADKAGLYTKTPFVDKVVQFEKRLLLYDISPEVIITADQKRLKIDNYALWKISDPKRFYESLKNYNVALSRIDDIVYSNLRDTFAQHTLDEIISEKRLEFLSDVTRRTRETLKDFGIYVVDVRVKRTDLPEANAKAVFERMKSERYKTAAKIRAEGEKEARTIRAETDKQVRIIIAEAEKKAEEIKGEGDAEAVKIYAEVYGIDTEFYSFWRTLEAYKNSLKNDTVIVLDKDVEFVKQLLGDEGVIGANQ
ncbi:MAG: modulator of FtsH protease HflC [Thermotogaceae bacterium]|nr:modulator of FtsH protease HflC [Thermotogaceae bacterium]